MMRSLYSGVSGLRNHQTRMDVIGNNIANVNTVGFKASRTIFQDMYSQNMKSASAPGANTGGVNPQQIGLGVTLSTIDTLFTRSAAQVTGNTYDLMIENDGFFVVRNGSEEYFTRAGNFYFDKANNLVTSSGFYLMGFKALVSPGTAAVEAIASTFDAAGSSIPFMEKTAVASVVVDAGSAPINTMTLNITDAGGVWQVDDGSTWTESGPMTAGGSVTFTHTDGLRSFTVTSTADYVPGSLKVGQGNQIQIRFTGTGTISSNSSIYSAKSETTNRVIDASGSGQVTIGLPGAKPGATYTIEDDPASNTIFVTQRLMDGTEQTIEVVRPQPEGSIYIPGFGMDVYVHKLYQAGDLHGTVLKMNTDGANGFAQGAPISTFENSETNIDKIYVDPLLYNVTIDKNGKVYGIARKDGFIKCPTTGDEVYVLADQRVEIGQVVVSVFDNQQALEKMGDNLYRKTANTGEPKYNKPGENGSGLIKPGALEMSNVDLAQEFTDMIVTQRGFQANSRIITVSDTLLEELINLKR